ncbi:hypothetical protein WA538_000271 [Blastocystis sp. DL]
MHAGTEAQPTGEPSGQEEKRESKPWSPEEKQIFYEGFNKHYKKYALIHEMLPSRSCTQIRQCFYREMKRIQSLLGESQSIVNWDDKDNLLCIFNSYATLLRGGNDVQKTMKSKKYIDRLRHSIDKINKRHALEASKKRKQEESAKEKSHQLKQSTTVSLTADPKPPTSKDPLFQPLTLPRHVSGLPKETMVIRLVPATDVLDSALRSCGYTPLLELTVRTTFTVRMLFAHLRTRWSKFCQRVQGVFRLTIAASSTTGVWVESRVSSKEPLVVSPHVVLSDTNSLLSNRMEKSAGAAEAYGNSVGNSMEQLRALAGLGDPLKLSIEWVFPRGLTPATASSPTRAASAPSSSPRCCPPKCRSGSRCSSEPRRPTCFVATSSEIPLATSARDADEGYGKRHRGGAGRRNARRRRALRRC